MDNVFHSEQFIPGILFPLQAYKQKAQKQTKKKLKSTARART